MNDSTLSKSDVKMNEEINESTIHRQRHSELIKLFDILTMLCIQVKQTLEKEIALETMLKQLFTIRKSTTIN